MSRACAAFSVIITSLCLNLPAANACLWDRETRAHEQEFKSQYNPQFYAPASPAEGSQDRELLHLTLGGVGGVSLLGAAVVLAQRRSAQPKSKS
jgi:hypothetical protein